MNESKYMSEMVVTPEIKNNAPYLQYGDILPAVGVLQKLLNRAGANLKVDGVFGSKTETAVLLFQEKRRMPSTGSVYKNTWDRIIAQTSLPIVDYIDVFDPSLLAYEVNDISKISNKYVTIGGMSNGVAQAATKLRLLANNVFLLRLHGHGSPGSIRFSIGEDSDPNIYYNQFGNVTTENINNDDIFSSLMRISLIFGPYGCAQLMHCSVAQGIRGRDFVQKLANILGVPVTAGVEMQRAGGMRSFRFECSTYTACPNGKTLQQWCNALPNFPPISVY